MRRHISSALVTMAAVAASLVARSASADCSTQGAYCFSDVNTANPGYGIYGQGDNGIGVKGYDLGSGHGLDGYVAGNGYGVYAVSAGTSGTGVYGVGGSYGVYGHSNGTATNYGV